jgi:hypothetical protein
LLRGWTLKFNKKATSQNSMKSEGKGNIVPDAKGIVEGAFVLYHQVRARRPGHE